MNKTAIYHACRVAFLCGEEKIPWHMVCHAVREGLNLKCKTYILQDKDYKKYPQLRELVAWMKGEITQESERKKVERVNQMIREGRPTREIKKVLGQIGFDVGNQQRPVRSGTKPKKANCK